jgi:hypothetical protein
LSAQGGAVAIIPGGAEEERLHPVSPLPFYLRFWYKQSMA